MARSLVGDLGLVGELCTLWYLEGQLMAVGPFVRLVVPIILVLYMMVLDMRARFWGDEEDFALAMVQAQRAVLVAGSIIDGLPFLLTTKIWMSMRDNRVYKTSLLLAILMTYNQIQIFREWWSPPQPSVSWFATSKIVEFVWSLWF